MSPKTSQKRKRFSLWILITLNISMKLFSIIVKGSRLSARTFEIFNFLESIDYHCQGRGLHPTDGQYLFVAAVFYCI